MISSGLRLPPKRTNLGDILQAASNVFGAMGYPATCQTIRTITPGANYSQDVCTVQGSADLHDAGLTLNMTPAQIQAGLDYEKAVRASLQANQPGWNPVQILTGREAPITAPIFDRATSVATSTPVQSQNVVPSSAVATSTNPVTQSQQNSLLTTVTNAISSVVNSVVDAVTPAVSATDILTPKVATDSPYNGPYQTNAPYVNQFFDKLQKTVAIGDFDIPIWALGAVGIVGLIGTVKVIGDGRNRRGRV